MENVYWAINGARVLQFLYNFLVTTNRLPHHSSKSLAYTNGATLSESINGLNAASNYQKQSKATDLLASVSRELNGRERRHSSQTSESLSFSVCKFMLFSIVSIFLIPLCISSKHLHVFS